MAPNRINDEMLIAYAAGSLSPDQRHAVEMALRDDPNARATVQRYRLASAALAGDDSVEPPLNVIEKARAIYQPTGATASRSWLDAIDAVIARLIFDSRVQPAGVRRANTGRQIQLTYATDEIEVDLQASRLEPNGNDRWRVMGQFAIEGAQRDVDFAVFAVGSDDPVVEETRCVDEPFTVELPSGRYEVRARVGQSTVVLPDVILE